MIADGVVLIGSRAGINRCRSRTREFRSIDTTRTACPGSCNRFADFARANPSFRKRILNLRDLLVSDQSDFARGMRGIRLR